MACFLLICGSAWFITNRERTMVESESVMIEAVPNFSEGRRRDVIAELISAIQVPGVMLLDATSDWDHHRSVLTVAGRPTAVLAGLLAAVAVAATRINLFQHQGVHPRLGAADVVPLVPLRGITLEECAALARELGERIGQELALPVYLYEAAACRPERRNLADVRRGGFERLVQEIGLPERQPDYGPARIGPAGAVIVGAREFLVAFNIFLDTDQVAIAQTISRKIRASSGGFPAVKAIGLLVKGQAQVSINLVDVHRISLAAVVETVCRLAEEQGSSVTHSELIGLLPQDVLLDVAAHCLKLPNLSRQQILEEAIRSQ